MKTCKLCGAETSVAYDELCPKCVIKELEPVPAAELVGTHYQAPEGAAWVRVTPEGTPIFYDENNKIIKEDVSAFDDPEECDNCGLEFSPDELTDGLCDDCHGEMESGFDDPNLD